MSTNDRLYQIEAWTKSGEFIADISHLVTGRSWTMGRNDAETLRGAVDLEALYAYALAIGVHPRTLLLPYQINLKFKRAGEYLFGTEITSSPGQVSGDSATVDLFAEGYLNLLKDRTVSTSFPEGTESTAIATGIIDYIQGVPGGDMGITIHPEQYVTGVPRERNYVAENAKNKLQLLTGLMDGRFDFRFSEDKVFQTVAQLGAVRTDIKLTQGVNIADVAVAQLKPWNRINGLGSGFGKDAVVSTPEKSIDYQSIAAFYMREKTSQFNSISIQETLDQNVGAQLAWFKEMRYIPVVTITGNELPSRFLSIGDRLPLGLTGHAYFDNVNGWYRIERMEVELDDQDFERAIKLYFDNQFIDPESGEDV